MSSSIIISKCALHYDVINVECRIEKYISPAVLGCTIRDTSMNEYDVQHIYLKESKDIELEIPLSNNQIDIFNKEGNEGNLMLALWKDDSFTERIIDTGWVKIDIRKSFLEELIDIEMLEMVIVEKLKSNGYNNIALIDFSKLRARYKLELIDKILNELKLHLPENLKNEFYKYLNNNNLNHASKLILDNILNAKEIAKSALINFRNLHR